MQMAALTSEQRIITRSCIHLESFVSSLHWGISIWQFYVQYEVHGAAGANARIGYHLTCSDDHQQGVTNDHRMTDDKKGLTMQRLLKC